MPYDEQLTSKTSSMRKECLARIYSNTKATYVKFNKEKSYQGLPKVPLPSWISNGIGIRLDLEILYWA